MVDEDAAAAQAGAFAGGAGVVCIAGTGANCFGVNARGERARADGLGPLLGDRGSGYRVGEAALRAACFAHDSRIAHDSRFAHDGRETSIRVLEACLEHYEVASVDELVQLVYRADFSKDRVAALFPVVLRCAQENDPIATRILRNAGEQLADSALLVLDALSLCDVATSGGVLIHDTPLRRAFEDKLRAHWPDVVVQTALHDAAIGAALLAKSS